MKLSESQLFTIESLNRIEGFEWPDGFKFAYMNTESNNHHHHPVFFCQSMPDRVAGGFDCKHGEEIRIKVRHSHIDFADSLISKEEFESVGGWVRHDNSAMPVDGDSVVQVMLNFAISQCFPASYFNWIDGDIELWRYKRTPNKPEKATDDETNNSIESLISQHKAARLSTLESRRQLERAEAIEHGLLLSIEAWAESQGFDIRLLDESNEKPELVIADWRDLRVGDVIECIIPDGGAIECGDLGVVSGFDGCSVIANFADQCGYQYKATSLGTYFKFISRPPK